MKKYLKQMRIKHYLKNGLIFLPLVFSGNLLKGDMLLKTILCFFAFSFVASIVYTINDICDVEKDRKHSVKKKRPIASGDISITKAWILICVLLVLAITLNYFAANNIYSYIYLFVYLIINILYSKGLKNIPLIDVAILVSGFLIRVLYGSSVIDIEVSNWLYLTIMSMSFYLGFGKRRNEIQKQKTSNGETRTVLKYYTQNFLDKNMYMCLALTIVFYSLWCIDINTVNNISNLLIWTVPIVMLICMKYSLIIEGDSQGDPVDVVLSDKLLISLIILYGGAMFFIVYSGALW